MILIILVSPESETMECWQQEIVINIKPRLSFATFKWVARRRIEKPIYVDMLDWLRDQLGVKYTGFVSNITRYFGQKMDIVRSFCDNFWGARRPQHIPQDMSCNLQQWLFLCFFSNTLWSFRASLAESRNVHGIGWFLFNCPFLAELMWLMETFWSRIWAIWHRPEVSE